MFSDCNILNLKINIMYAEITKERLNGLHGVSITQKNFIWYLNGKKWNGNLIKINTKQ